MVFGVASGVRGPLDRPPVGTWVAEGLKPPAEGAFGTTKSPCGDWHFARWGCGGHLSASRSRGLAGPRVGVPESFRHPRTPVPGRRSIVRHGSGGRLPLVVRRDAREVRFQEFRVARVPIDHGVADFERVARLGEVDADQVANAERGRAIGGGSPPSSGRTRQRSGSQASARARVRFMACLLRMVTGLQGCCYRRVPHTSPPAANGTGRGGV